MTVTARQSRNQSSRLKSALADTEAAGKPSKAKGADIVPLVPIKPQPREIAFPGGSAAFADDGRTLTVTIDPKTGGRLLAGSDHREFAEILVGGVLSSLAIHTPAEAAKRAAGTAAALAALEPGDAVEAMIAGQAIAMFNASMEASRRAMLEGQPFEVAQAYRKAAANASRTFIELLSALDRKRGKGGQQLVRIEHVHVSGGQAIVGSVTQVPGGGGGVAAEMPEEPHETDQLAHEFGPGRCLPTVRSTSAEREAMPRSGDAKRALPGSRRHQHGA
jgi:hypothetical protein